MKTALKSYHLWYDGSVAVKAKDVERFITKVPSGKLFVDEMTDDIKQFNLLMSSEQKIRPKAVCSCINLDWNLPDKYKTMNVRSYVVDKLVEEGDLSEEELSKRLSRVLMELNAYQAQGFTDLLRCLIYIVDTFTEHNVVWGVGRGSSVSSYVLYLIGIHDIDSVEFDLPFSDFIKPIFTKGT